VIKISEEELAFLADTEDLAAGVRKVWHPGLRLLVITAGRAGCRYATAQFSGRVPGFEVTPVDTTGAGDGFVAGLLKGLVDDPQADRNEAQLRAICRYANAVGAITTTERGAIPALPTANQVDEFLRRGAAPLGDSAIEHGSSRLS
jgi:fructokinase